MQSHNIKAATGATLLLLSLVGCASTAVMEKSQAVQQQPELKVSVDGKFGGFGDEGQFTVGQRYFGMFSRDASSSSWFGVVGSDQRGLAADITKNGTNQSWSLQCHGEQSNLTLGSISMSGSEPFVCDILADGKSVGEYQITPERKLVGSAEEKGRVTLGDTNIDLAAVTRAQGSAFDAGMPLGYSFSVNGEEVAATQTNGGVSIQMVDGLTEAQQDAIVVGSIASALCWRPENAHD